MKLDHAFSMPLPIDEAWGLLTDVERIAPCMPGARLQEIEGDEYRGLVKVKVGPVATQYKGTARFVERDDTERRAVIKAEGRDARGQGNATATISMELTPAAYATDVKISTELSITGRVAQLGRGAISEVSDKLLRQFVADLEAMLETNHARRSADERAAPAPAEGIRLIDAPEPPPVDLLDAAGGAIAKRLIVVAAAVFMVWMLVRRLRRH